jgi:hypothetical protein
MAVAADELDANAATTLSATQTDVAGNVSDASADRVLTTDLAAPNAPIFALGTGVANGATAAEALQVSGVVTVTAENGVSTAVTFTSSTNTVIKAITGTGAAQAIALSAAELTALGDGNISVSAIATDAAGNASQAGTSSFILDTTAPTLKITDNVIDTVEKGENVTFTFTFDEDVTDFDSDDVSISTGTKGAFSGSGSSYTLAVTPPTTNFESGDINVNVAAGAAKDAAGNDSVVATEHLQAYNNVAESIALGTSNGVALGNLIAPVQVEGKWYYVLDVNENGGHGTGDTLTMTNLIAALGGDLNEVINGVTVRIPTLGESYTNNKSAEGTDQSTNATDVNGNSQYDDLLAIWDFYNGNGTGKGSNGTPTVANVAELPATINWFADNYWSATSTESGSHANVNLDIGYVGSGIDGNSYHVVLEVV